MPALERNDVKDLSLARVKTMMKERLDDVQAIKERSDDGKIINATGEDAGRATVIFQDLNLLGERHDELKAIDNGDEKVAKLNDWLNTPGGAAPVYESAPKQPVWKDAATLIAESDGYQRMAKQGGSFSLEVPFSSVFTKTILGTDDSLAGVTAEFPPQSVRLPGVQVPVLFQENNIASMFLQGSTNQNAVTYMVETVTSQAAAETAEGAAKPEADISFTEGTSPVTTIAVTLPVTNQLLEDVGFMRSWVGGRLRLFVLNREDSQLIKGAGTGVNLTGVLTAAGTGAQSYSIASANTDATVAFDAVYRAITDVRQAFLNPSGIAMAAGTWERFRLGKDANKNYLLGGAAGDVANRLWGLPVTVNESMPAEAAAAEPIFVAAREAAMVTRRNSLTLAVTDSHADEFSKNILRFRAEMRTAFPIFRPAGISVVTSTT